MPDTPLNGQPNTPELHHLEMMLTYADCDPAQIIYFATWFPWMERVQSSWMYSSGMRQDTLLRRFGFSTVTRATDCEYLSPASLFQRIRISLRAGRLGRTSAQSIMHMTRVDDGVLVARGSITVVTLDGDGSSTALPDRLRALYLGQR